MKQEPSLTAEYLSSVNWDRAVDDALDDAQDNHQKSAMNDALTIQQNQPIDEKPTKSTTLGSIEMQQTQQTVDGEVVHTQILILDLCNRSG